MEELQRTAELEKRMAEDLGKLQSKIKELGVDPAIEFLIMKSFRDKSTLTDQEEKTLKTWATQHKPETSQIKEYYQTLKDSHKADAPKDAVPGLMDTFGNMVGGAVDGLKELVGMAPPKDTASADSLECVPDDSSNLECVPVADEKTMIPLPGGGQMTEPALACLPSEKPAAPAPTLTCLPAEKAGSSAPDLACLPGGAQEGTLACAPAENQNMTPALVCKPDPACKPMSAGEVAAGFGLVLGDKPNPKTMAAELAKHKDEFSPQTAEKLKAWAEGGENSDPALNKALKLELAQGQAMGKYEGNLEDLFAQAYGHDDKKIQDSFDKIHNAMGTDQFPAVMGVINKDLEDAVASQKAKVPAGQSMPPELMAFEDSVKSFKDDLVAPLAKVQVEACSAAPVGGGDHGGRDGGGHGEPMGGSLANCLTPAQKQALLDTAAKDQDDFTGLKPGNKQAHQEFDAKQDEYERLQKLADEAKAQADAAKAKADASDKALQDAKDDYTTSQNVANSADNAPLCPPPPAPPQVTTGEKGKVEIPKDKIEIPGGKIEITGDKVNLPGIEVQVPGTQITVPKHTVVIEGKSVTIPDTKIDIPGRTITLPGSQYTIEGGKIHIKGGDFSTPGSTIKLPGGQIVVEGKTVDLPPIQVKIPGSTITLPGSTVDVGETKIVIGGTKVTIPDQKVTILENEITFEGKTIKLPGIDVTVPSHKVDLPSTTIEVGKTTVTTGETKVITGDTKVVTGDGKIEITGDKVNLPGIEVKLPGTQVTVPQHSVVIEGKSVTIPDTKIDIPERTITLPGSQYTIEGGKIHIKGGDFNAPGSTIELPGGQIVVGGKTINLPPLHVKIPDSTITLPGSSVDIGGTKVVIGGTKVTIPDQKVTILEDEITIGGKTIKLPGLDIAVPSHKVDIPSTTIEVGKTTVTTGETKVITGDTHVTTGETKVTTGEGKIITGAPNINPPGVEHKFGPGSPSSCDCDEPPCVSVPVSVYKQIQERLEQLKKAAPAGEQKAAPGPVSEKDFKDVIYHHGHGLLAAEGVESVFGIHTHQYSQLIALGVTDAQLHELSTLALEGGITQAQLREVLDWAHTQNVSDVQMAKAVDVVINGGGVESAMASLNPLSVSFHDILSQGDDSLDLCLPSTGVEMSSIQTLEDLFAAAQIIEDSKGQLHIHVNDATHEAEGETLTDSMIITQDHVDVSYSDVKDGFHSHPTLI